MTDLFDVVIPDGDDLRTATGSKVIYKGEEIKDVTEIEILPMTCDAVMMVKITVPLGKVTTSQRFSSIPSQSLSVEREFSWNTVVFAIFKQRMGGCGEGSNLATEVLAGSLVAWDHL